MTWPCLNRECTEKVTDPRDNFCSDVCEKAVRDRELPPLPPLAAHPTCMRGFA